MATTTTLYATGATGTTATGTTWTNPTNATGSTTGTYAVWTSTTRSVTGTLTLTGYDFSSQVPAGSTITGVTAVVKHHENTTATTVLTILEAQLYAGTVALGFPVALTRTTSTTATQTINFTTMPTVAELANLRVSVGGKRANSTTSTTVNVDYVSLVVTYTAPVVVVGNTSALTENFSTGLDSAVWETAGTGSVSTASGSAAFSGSVTLQTKNYYTYNSLFFQVIPPTAGTASFRLEEGSLDRRRVQFSVASSGSITYGAGNNDTGSFNNPSTFTAGQPLWLKWEWANSAHRFYQSSDGVTWTELPGVVTQHLAGGDSVRFFAEHFSGATGGGIDNINIASAPPNTFKREAFLLFF